MENTTIICYGICSENCAAMRDGKCILEAKKAEEEKEQEDWKVE